MFQIRIELHDGASGEEDTTPINLVFHETAEKFFLLQVFSQIQNPDQTVTHAGLSKYTFDLRLNGPANPLSLLSFSTATEFRNAFRLALPQCPSIVAVIASSGAITVLVVQR